MLALRAVAGTSPAVAQTIPNVLARLAEVRQSVGVDGPQQLMDFTAPPVDLAAIAAATPVAGGRTPSPRPRRARPGAAGRHGLSEAQIDAEIATVPEPQQPIAAMLPLSDLPAGWTLGKLGERHLETFNADNLFEKIDGRAESFIDYSVKGMAYADLPSDRRRLDRRAGLYLRDGQHAQGAGQVRRGEARGAQAAADRVGRVRRGRQHDLLFGPVLHPGRLDAATTAKFAAFALELARRIAAKQQPSRAAVAWRSSGPTGNGGKEKATGEAPDQGDRVPRRSSPCSPRSRARRPEVRRAGRLRL